MPKIGNGQKWLVAVAVGTAIILLAAGIMYALGADVRIRKNASAAQVNGTAILRNHDDIKEIEQAQQKYCDTTETKLDDIKSQVDQITGFLMPGARPTPRPVPE